MKISQKDKILKHLKRRSISTWEAIKHYKCTRLARVVHELKRDGIEIRKKMEGKGQSQYARYFLVRS